MLKNGTFDEGLLEKLKRNKEGKSLLILVVAEIMYLLVGQWQGKLLLRFVLRALVARCYRKY